MATIRHRSGNRKLVLGTGLLVAFSFLLLLSYSSYLPSLRVSAPSSLAVVDELKHIVTPAVASLTNSLIEVTAAATPYLRLGCFKLHAANGHGLADGPSAILTSQTSTWEMGPKACSSFCSDVQTAAMTTHFAITEGRHCSCLSNVQQLEWVPGSQCCQECVDGEGWNTEDVDTMCGGSEDPDVASVYKIVSDFEPRGCRIFETKDRKKTKSTILPPPKLCPHRVKSPLPALTRADIANIEWCKIECRREKHTFIGYARPPETRPMCYCHSHVTDGKLQKTELCFEAHTDSEVRMVDYLSGYMPIPTPPKPTSQWSVNETISFLLHYAQATGVTKQVTEMLDTLAEPPTVALLNTVAGKTKPESSDNPFVLSLSKLWTNAQLHLISLEKFAKTKDLPVWRDTTSLDSVGGVFPANWTEGTLRDFFRFGSLSSRFISSESTPTRLVNERNWGRYLERFDYTSHKGQLCWQTHPTTADPRLHPTENRTTPLITEGRIFQLLKEKVPEPWKHTPWRAFPVEVLQNIDLSYEAAFNASYDYRVIPWWHTMEAIAMEEALGANITISTHLSVDRLPELLRMATAWENPISAATWVKSGHDILQVRQWIDDNPVLNTWVSFHLVLENYRSPPSHRRYPVNFMRNVALNYTSTIAAFMLDVDFAPSPDTRVAVNSVWRIMPPSQPLCIVVPAFDVRQSDAVTINETSLIQRNFYELYKQSRVTKSAPSFYPSQGPTDYKYYWDTFLENPENFTAYYRVQYHEWYEPYMICEAAATPRFDPRFRGWGQDKNSQVEQLNYQGYQFYVAVRSFVYQFEHPTGKGWSDIEVAANYNRWVYATQNKQRKKYANANKEQRRYMWKELTESSRKEHQNRLHHEGIDHRVTSFQSVFQNTAPFHEDLPSIAMTYTFWRELMLDAIRHPYQSTTGLWDVAGLTRQRSLHVVVVKVDMHKHSFANSKDWIGLVVLFGMMLEGAVVCVAPREYVTVVPKAMGHFWMDESVGEDQTMLATLRDVSSPSPIPTVTRFIDATELRNLTLEELNKCENNKGATQGSSLDHTDPRPPVCDYVARLVDPNGVGMDRFREAVDAVVDIVV